ncbi:ATP-dependent zinc metalloprotease FTSH 10 [Trichinella spiralis]|uniref:ATP-dependent zinc metalloprotease FTSH 10 n=1 Tax=Trichinella spiralis TaxID=6334 RepID=A0ABR3KEN9_TRISP
MSHQIASELLEEQSNARNALYRRHKHEMVMLFRIKEMDTVTLYSGTKTMLDIKKRMQKHLFPYIETQVINDCGIIKWTKSDVKDVFNSCMGFVIKESILSFQQRKSELSERQKKEAAELYDVQMEQWLKLEFRRKKNKPTMIPEIDLEKDVSLWNNSMLSTLNNLQKKQKKRYN